MKRVSISWWHIFVICLMTSCSVAIPERLGSDMSISNGKKDGWSASGDLVTGSASKEISLQANFDEPGTYTLQFDAQYPNRDVFAPFPAVKVIAEADIFWSVEGNSVRRKVSLTPGMSISGTGQGVKVVLRDKTVTTVPPTPVPAFTYPVSVQVVKGMRPSIEPPYYRRAEDFLYDSAPFGSTTLSQNIPVEAGPKSMRVSVSVLNGVGVGLAIPSGNLYLEFVLENGAPAPIETIRMQDPQNVGWIPIPPGAIYYVLGWASAPPVGVATLYMSALWGIDG